MIYLVYFTIVTGSAKHSKYTVPGGRLYGLAWTLTEPPTVACTGTPTTVAALLLLAVPLLVLLLLLALPVLVPEGLLTHCGGAGSDTRLPCTVITGAGDNGEDEAVCIRGVPTVCLSMYTIRAKMRLFSLFWPLRFRKKLSDCWVTHKGPVYIVR